MHSLSARSFKVRHIMRRERELGEMFVPDAMVWLARVFTIADEEHGR